MWPKRTGSRGGPNGGPAAAATGMPRPSTSRNASILAEPGTPGSSPTRWTEGVRALLHFGEEHDHNRPLIASVGLGRKLRFAWRRVLARRRAAAAGRR